MELADGTLTDADALRQQGTDQGAISRLYYACFHAAQAVLYDKGFSPESHDAVKQLFGREVVITGDASRSDGEFLSDMYDDILLGVNTEVSRPQLGCYGSQSAPCSRSHEIGRAHV